MKAITRHKLYEQFGADLKTMDIREKQLRIAQAWLAGFRGHPCDFEGELAEVWKIGKLEAEKRVQAPHL